MARLQYVLLCICMLAVYVMAIAAVETSAEPETSAPAAEDAPTVRITTSRMNLALRLVDGIMKAMFYERVEQEPWRG